MPVPPNQTAATAIDIGTLTDYTPYETTQDAWDGAQTVDDLWYSYLPVSGDKVLEIYGYGNGTTYIPHSTVWTGPIAGIAQLDNSDDSQSRPVQQDIVTFVVPGERVYIRFRKQGGNNNPSILTIRIARGQDETIIAGDLFINDSSPGYPGIAMDRGTGVPVKYYLDYPAGEGQVILTNGIIAVIDAFNANGPVIYDPDITIRNTPTMPDSHYIEALGTGQIDGFWVLSTFGGGNAHAVFFDEDGNTDSPLDLGSACTDLTASSDNTLVFTRNNVSGVRKVTNPGGVASVIITLDATYSFGTNIMTMQDDTLLVSFEKAAVAAYIKQFDFDGNLIQQIDLPHIIGQLLERIFADPEDPDYFWIWWQDNESNHFERIEVATGDVVESLERFKFVESVSQENLLVGSEVFSGADFSCVPIVLRRSGNIAASGLYILTGTGGNSGGDTNPILRHDVNWIDTAAGTSENVKIPDPFVDLFLAGDE